ncbi:diacylglycerol kinase [Tundrisphaera sp. TA3]|uniref:diacylglycerol kinase n=1 Tax=Tundrisphaera sp. TA3 TaxID=3435775 RepID=UPI003EC10976
MRTKYAEPAPAPTEPLDPLLDDLAAFDASEAWRARAGRRTLREKLLAGLSGLKHASRGDSSFFAHGYRVLLVSVTAALLGVSPHGWCLLVLAFSLIVLAELNHSAVDTLARAIGDPDEPRLKVAREIAAAGVLLAVVASAAVAIAILTLRLGDLLGWWR